MSSPAEKNFPIQKAPGAFPHWEAHVAGRLGISRDDVRELRQLHLVEGEHWVMDRNRVKLSDAGLDHLRALVSSLAQKNGAPSSDGVPPENAPQRGDAAQSAPAQDLSLPDPAAPESLTIVRANLTNWRVVLAVRATGEQVPVHINAQTPESSRHFRAGMSIKAAFFNGRWQQEGRSPRFYGRY